VSQPTFAHQCWSGDKEKSSLDLLFWKNDRIKSALPRLLQSGGRLKAKKGELPGNQRGKAKQGFKNP